MKRTARKNGVKICLSSLVASDNVELEKEDDLELERHSAVTI
jgi:hypothetical protein